VGERENDAWRTAVEIYLQRQERPAPVREREAQPGQVVVVAQGQPDQAVADGSRMFERLRAELSRRSKALALHREPRPSELLRLQNERGHGSADHPDLIAEIFFAHAAQDAHDGLPAGL